MRGDLLLLPLWRGEVRCGRGGEAAGEARPADPAAEQGAELAEEGGHRSEGARPCGRPSGGGGVPCQIAGGGDVGAGESDAGQLLRRRVLAEPLPEGMELARVLKIAPFSLTSSLHSAQLIPSIWSRLIWAEQ